MDSRRIYRFLQSNLYLRVHICGSNSFQLETDPTLLIPKARAALERYGHQVVIGNDLHRRKFEVVFVSRIPDAPENSSGAESGSLGAGKITETWLRINGEEKEIEEDIVGDLKNRHEAWIGAESTP